MFTKFIVKGTKNNNNQTISMMISSIKQNNLISFHNEDLNP